MSGLDKILEQITQEAQDEANKILLTAQEAAKKLIASGKKEADDMAQAIRKQSELDIAAAADRIQSGAELREKRVILQAKQEKIEEVFEQALKYLDSLDDQEYAQTICRMISKYATGQEGRILFNSRDLSRLSDDVRSSAKKHHLEVQEEPVSIRGGFILSYGDIEENCSFDVLIDASKEELQDGVGQLLFGSRNH